MKTRKDLLNYWSTRKDYGKNRVGKYVTGKKKSEYMVKIFEKYVPKGNSILELGCNCGRNLLYLHQAGYKRLAGIEINPYAIQVMRSHFPDLKASIMEGSIEDCLPSIKSADVILTMACLCHCHTDVEWQIFDEMMRIARRKIILFEDEVRNSRRHFPRYYPDYFKSNFDLVFRKRRIPGMYWKYKLSVLERKG